MKNLVLFGLTLTLTSVYSTGLVIHPTKLDSTRGNTLNINPTQQVEYSNTQSRQSATKSYSLSNTSKAQKELKLQGYYTGDIDVVVGDSTRYAIKRFQAHNNLDINGELDTKTLEALNVINDKSLYSEY